MKTAKPKKAPRPKTTKPTKKETKPLCKKSEVLVKKRSGRVKPEAFSDKETQRDNEEQFRMMVEEAPIPTIMQAEDGEVLQISRSWTELTGYTIDDVRSLDEWITSAVYGEGADEVRDYLRGLFSSSSSNKVEFVIRTRSGGLRYWSFSTSAAGRLTDGRRFIIGMALDVTERRRAEEVRVRTIELEAINKELEAFSYTISHDLKSPLRSIASFTRILSEDYSDRLDDTGRDYLRRANDASMKMSELIEAILTMSRQTRGELRKTTVNLSVLAKITADELMRREPGRKANFIIEDGITVEGDLIMLELVMQNLLQNSWKFTGKHESARIEFGTTQREGSTVYYVRDDGAGFGMEYADKLFMPFTRLHSESEFSGLGIGLSTVARIISRHGGRIWAEGEPEKGATFYFLLG